MQKLLIGFLLCTAVAGTALADDVISVTNINVPGRNVGEEQTFPFNTTVALSLTKPGVLELPKGGSFVLPPLTPTVTAAPIATPLAPTCLPLGTNPFLLIGQEFVGQFPDPSESSGFFPYQAWTLEPPLNTIGILSPIMSMTQNMPTCTGLSTSANQGGGTSGAGVNGTAGGGVNGGAGLSGTSGAGLAGTAGGGGTSGAGTGISGTAGGGVNGGAGLSGTAGGGVNGGAGVNGSNGGAANNANMYAGANNNGNTPPASSSDKEQLCTSLPGISGSPSGLLGGGGGVNGAITNAAGTVNGAVSNVNGNLSGSLSNASGAVSGAVNNVSGTVNGALSNVEGTVSGTLSNVTGTLNGNVSNLTGTVNGMVSNLTGIVNGNAVTNFSGVITGTVSNVSGTVNAALSNVSGIVNGNISKLTGTVNGTVSNLTGTLSGAVSNLNGSVNGMLGNVTGSVNGTVNNLSGTVNGATGNLTSAANAASGNLSGAVAGTTGGINIGSSINGIGGDCGQGQVPVQSSQVVHFVPQMGLTPVIVVLPKEWNGYADPPVPGGTSPVPLPGVDAKHGAMVLAGYTSLCANNIPQHVASEDINPVWPCTKHANPGTCGDGTACVNGTCGDGGSCSGYIPAVTTNTPRGAVTLFARNTSMSTILPVLPPLPGMLAPANAPAFGEPMPLLQPVGCPGQADGQDPLPSPSLNSAVDQLWPCGVRDQEIMTGPHGKLPDKPESYLNLSVYWVCLDDTEFQILPNTITFTYMPSGGLFGLQFDTDHGLLATCTWQWLPQFVAAVINYPISSATTPNTGTGTNTTGNGSSTDDSSNVTVSTGSTSQGASTSTGSNNGNLAVETTAIVVNATTQATTIPGITPPPNSFMSIPMGTPVAFDMSVAGSTITLPAGGDITDAEGGTIDMPQRSVLIALGKDPSTGNVGVISGFLLNTGQYANINPNDNNNMIRLFGDAGGGTSPLISYNNGGAVSVSYGQLQGWGNTVLSAANDTGTIIEYPLKESQLQISTTEIGVPPDAVIPIPSESNGTTAAVPVPAAITTPQDMSTLPSSP